MTGRRNTALSQMGTLDAWRFDLDGVLTDTASVLDAAWKTTFDELLSHRAGDGGCRSPPLIRWQEFLRHLIGAPQMLELRLGIPAIEVLAAIESAQAELVAVGWPRSEDPRRGAVAKEILERSLVAVVLVAVA